MAERLKKGARSAATTAAMLAPSKSARATHVVHKRTPRTHVQAETYFAILRAAGQFERQIVEVLKREGLTGSQYNVLRILRGASDGGLSCGDIGDRLIRHDPDVTRLVDRLETRGFIERTRQATDRRIVRTCITAKGLEVLARLDGPTDALHEEQLGHMDEARLAALTKLLDEARTKPT